MARATTTLNGAVTVNDNSITVASATGIAAGMFGRCDDEVVQVANSYLSGTVIPVLRGREGTTTQAHVTTAGITFGLASDFTGPAPQSVATYMTAGKSRTVTSITATATLTLPVVGSDMCVRLNGTAAITLTIPVPTKDMDWTELNIASDGVAQHLLTFTGGLSGAGTNYDVITINSTAPMASKFVAINGLWLAYAQPAISGTTTNIAGAIA